MWVCLGNEQSIGGSLLRNSQHFQRCLYAGFFLPPCLLTSSWWAGVSAPTAATPSIQPLSHPKPTRRPSCCPSCPQLVGALVEAAERPGAPGAVTPATVALIVDLLCFCVSAHSYRIK